MYNISFENFSCQNYNVSSVSSIFKYHPDKTNDKFVTSQLISYTTSFRRKRRIIVYGTVARYGPQSAQVAETTAKLMKISFQFGESRFEKRKKKRKVSKRILPNIIFPHDRGFHSPRSESDPTTGQRDASP